jgi:hypothetical protein
MFPQRHEGVRVGATKVVCLLHLIFQRDPYLAWNGKYDSGPLFPIESGQGVS